MARVYDAGFRTLDLTAAAEIIRRGERFPDRQLVITFDDGYENVHRAAVAVLQSMASRPRYSSPSVNGIPRRPAPG